MSRNYQNSDEFRREDQRLCRQIDARAERMAAERVREAAPEMLEAMSTPRRPNGFQDRMRRDPAFVAMLKALKAAQPYFASGAVPHIQEQMAVAIAKAEGRIV
jgi:hypothetical protein